MLLSIHVSTVVISIVLFNIRAYGLVTEAGWRKKRLLLVMPHVNDSLLLFSAIAMCFQIKQYPLVNDWLSVKLVLLLLYIILGLLFMRKARSNTQRWWLYMVSMLCFGFIVSVAITHNPLGLMSILF